jgi:hypothetical protein
MVFRCHSNVLHLPRRQERARAASLRRFDIVLTPTPLSLLHLPRVEEPASGNVSTPFSCPPPLSHTRASRKWTFTTFLTLHLPRLQSEPEMTFRRRFRVLHLPHLQERAGGGTSTPFSPLHLPRLQERARNDVLTPFSRARASRRRCSRPSTCLACKSEPEIMFRCRSRILHLPHVQERAGGGISTPFSPSTSLACKSEPEMTFRHRSRILHPSRR